MQLSFGVIVFVVLASTLAPIAQAQDWNPGSIDLEPIGNVAKRLKDAQLFLYLDKDCNKIAVVAPNVKTREIADYSPILDRINWWDRLAVLPDPSKCASGVSAWRGLADARDPQTLPGPAACDPNDTGTGSIDQERLTTSCWIPVEDVQYLVVLNSRRQPVIMLQGDGAREATPTVVPARLLARKPNPGGACSPTTPTPCKTGMTGKLIGNPPTCICSY